MLTNEGKKWIKAASKDMKKRIKDYNKKMKKKAYPNIILPGYRKKIKRNK